ncbi:MAG: hypothetical protein M1821_006184 [Bathelium mastoideum]|nr:MAG: hypothetical protein M1821_006184 [Bathelium mastoideum]KAI9686522.1 MAG: hypothetical protein M1822_003533 [Bathelium mastoideum]
MASSKKLKRQKITHIPTSNGLVDQSAPSQTPVSKSKEDALLRSLAANQRRPKPGLLREQNPDGTAQEATPIGRPTVEISKDEAAESTFVNSRLKNATLPGLAEVLETLDSCDFKLISIISATKIRNKVQQATQMMTAPPTEERSKKPLVLGLTAREGAAAKLITIAEITKRNLNEAKLSWYQYSCVEPKMVGIQRKKPNPSAHNAADEDEDEDDIAFETMLSAVERKLMDKPKFRTVPVMTLFLSNCPIKQLRDAYGYVTCKFQ